MPVPDWSRRSPANVSVQVCLSANYWPDSPVVETVEARIVTAGRVFPVGSVWEDVFCYITTPVHFVAIGPTYQPFVNEVFYTAPKEGNFFAYPDQAGDCFLIMHQDQVSGPEGLWYQRHWCKLFASGGDALLSLSSAPAPDLPNAVWPNVLPTNILRRDVGAGVQPPHVRRRRAS